MEQNKREIKFRAWDASTGEMLRPEDYRHDTVRVASAHMLKHFDCVMQFTGLKDKNGVEIYEGDVIRLHEYGNVEVPVVFRNGSFCVHGFNWQVETCEVTGNIHQHPDLLK